MKKYIVCVLFFAVLVNPCFSEDEAYVQDLGVPESSKAAIESVTADVALASLPDIMSTHEVQLRALISIESILKPGIKAFANSAETIKYLPNQLYGRKFLRMSKDGGKITVQKGGYAAVLVLENSAAMEQLAGLGFERVNLRAFNPFDADADEKAICMQKKLKAGESFTTKAWTLVIFGIADSGGIPYSELTSLEPKVYLPDGREFKTWEVPFAFSKTYFVDQKHPDASDGNPGTEDRPFATISKAAEVLEAGQRVIVGPGIYRERINPLRGGTSRENMISYEAQDGAEVIITGAEPLEVSWSKSITDPTVFPFAGSWNHPWEKPRQVHHNMENLWTCRIPESLIRENNPFTKPNLPKWMLQHLSRINKRKDYTLDTEIYYKSRGMVFQDGKRLTQFTMWEDFKRKAGPGSFWVSPDGKNLHVRPFEDIVPFRVKWEITTREQLFYPDAYNIGYIRVKGFTFEKAANPFPVPQYAAVSTNAGHHWIIEENTIRQINSIGIDLGRRAWEWRSPEMVGHHIVRGNRISDCGVCGISGMGDYDFAVLVEDNILDRNAWHDVCAMMETSGIKTHFNENSLYRRNIVRDTFYGPGIWLDFGNINCRVTQNVVTGANSPWGAMFFEASLYHNMLDNNICWGNTGHGLYQHTCQKLIIANNLSANNTGNGLQLNMGKRDVFGRVSTGGHHRVFNNIIINNAQPIVYPPNTPPMEMENNITEGIEVEFDPQTLILKGHGKQAKPNIHVPFVDFNFFSEPLDPNSQPGPFGIIPTEPETIKANPIVSSRD